MCSADVCAGISADVEDVVLIFALVRVLKLLLTQVLMLVLVQILCRCWC